MTPYTILLYVFVLYIFQLFSRRSYSHSHSMYHISMTSYKHFLIYFSYSTFSRHARALTVTLHSIYRISMTPYMHVCYCIFVSYIFPPYSRRLLAPYILCISMTPRWYTSSYLTFSRHIQCALTITRHSMYHWHPTRYISSYFLFSRHSQDALATPSANAPAVATLHATQHDARVWAVSERCVAVCCRVRGCVLQSVAVCWMCCSVRQCVVVLWKVRGCVL